MEYGHGEIDTVRSAKNTSLECGVMRFEIYYKLKDGKSATVIEALNKLERKLTPEIFKKLFKSITADNGSEFMDFEGLEKLINDWICILLISIENYNGVIRHFFKKGTELSQISEERIREVQTWMNNYPRRIFDGYTSYLELYVIRKFYSFFR